MPKPDLTMGNAVSDVEAVEEAPGIVLPTLQPSSDDEVGRAHDEIIADDENATDYKKIFGGYLNFPLEIAGGRSRHRYARAAGDTIEATTVFDRSRP